VPFRTPPFSSASTVPVFHQTRQQSYKDGCAAAQHHLFFDNNPRNNTFSGNFALFADLYGPQTPISAKKPLFISIY